MKKLLFAFTLSIALSLGSQSAFAQAKKKVAIPATPTTPAAEATKAVDAVKAKTDRPLPYSGDVAAVDASAKTITLKAKDPTKVRVFRVLDTTTIVNAATAGGTEAPAKLSDVKADAYITGTYKKAADGSLEAVKVMLGKVKTVRAPKAKAEGEPAPKK